MKRLQISIDADLDQALGLEADREGVSKAEIVRRSLRARIDRLPPIEEDPYFSMFGTFEGGGLREGETIDDVIYGPVKRHG